jgi:nitroreductase/NAD-dependent dihydropyrimidine dehydrogenase PreA subunit
MAKKIDFSKPHPQYPGEIIINEKKCTGCGKCVNTCSSCVLEMRGGRPELVKPYYCIRCGHCAAVCEYDAIISTSTEPKKITPAELKKSPTPEALQFLLRARRSVRFYKNRPVLKKDLEKILEAGRYTATGTNSQDVRYIVFTDQKKIDELRKIATPLVVKMMKRAGRIASTPLGKMLMGELLASRMKDLYLPGMDIITERIKEGKDPVFFNAPALIIVYAEKIDDTASFGCAAALYNCSLMAHTLGIGCCFNGFLQTVINYDKKVKKIMGIPKYCKCWGAMTLGYQNVKFNKLTRRKPVDVTWV